ncbi:periplasmic protein [Legionella gratiana]|uniref:Periplasmic protein n=1 Tax=Legionella gratiana TaxID=45066 RepID=A0A378JGM8_9GAMM|nr:translocation/assembly module TamB domain-containing protein [Legionella gratiana]KTD10732.1 periplasmic protein [Legionella gratiana]STX43820.1 periplasmic protein [Legionella gratiana]
MIRVLVKTVNFTLSLLIILGLIVVFLFATTPGLLCVIELCRFYVPGTLKIQHIEGSLINNFTIGTLEYQNKSLKVKIKQLNVQWHPHSLRENQRLTAQWHDLKWKNAADKIIESKKGTVIATGILPNLQINLNTKVTTALKNHWTMDAKISGTMPWLWTFDANLTQPQSSSTQDTLLYTNLSAKGEIKAKNKGNLFLTIGPGFYHEPDNTIPILHFKGGTVKVTLAPEKLEGSGILVVDEHKNLNMHFQLPKFALNSGFSDNQLINSKLSLNINSLDFLHTISPELKTLKGQLTISLNMTGTVKKRKIESQLILSKASFSLPELGINLDTLELNVLGKDKFWEASGSVISAGHHLSLSGKGTLSRQFTGDLTLEGNDFPFINTSEYQIHISPKLNLHLTPTIRALSGTVFVPYAEIKPRTFHNSISLPEDVVYKRKENSTPPMTFLSSMDIAIEMGKEVAVNAKGLKGFLDGTLHTKQLQEGSINAYGELSIRDGTYKAYGQELAIKQGQLIFTGGLINNPGINVRAAKKINRTPTTFSSSSQLLDFNSTNLQNINYGETMTLGVEVTGRLTQPKIQLFSEPAVLSQADILSMLILGRPANQANKAGAQLLLTAITSMSLSGTTNSFRLLEQLKESAGIDFNVQTNTNYNQLNNTASDSTSFMVGKSLSKRLYLSYNIGLSQTDTNILTLRYLLNKFFSIQISNSDTSSAIDVLYTSRKGNSTKKKKRPS